MAVAQEVLLKQMEFERTKESANGLGHEYETANGEPEEKNMAGARHSGVGTRLIRRLGDYIESNSLGEIYGADATFTIGERPRLPDVSFVAADRIPPEGEPVSAWPIAPDLAVEVISPNDVYLEVMTKMNDYFAAGVKQVWLVDPEYRSVSVYRSPSDVAIFTGEQELASENLFPGFRCRLNEIFKTPAKLPKS